MPLQVQGQIINEYTAVVSVPATAEVITEAALADTAIALGNRIEFVRQLQTVNPSVSFFREDFLHAQKVNQAVTPVTAVWMGDTPWRASEIVSPFNVCRVEQVNNVSDIAEAHYHNNPGRIRIDSPTGPGGINFSKFAGAAGEGIPARYVKEMVCIVKPGSLASGMKFEFGLQSSGGGVGINPANAAALSFLFNPALGPNWWAKSSLSAGSSAHLQDTLVAPSTTGSMHKLTIKRIQLDPEDPDAFKWQWYLFDALLVEKVNGEDDYFLPTALDPCQMRFACEVPDLTTTQYWDVDWVSGEFETLR